MIYKAHHTDVSAPNWLGSAPVFDSSQLSISIGDDQDFMQEMVISGIRALSEQISDLARPGDQWQQMTHRLKGLAASIGAKRMAQVAKCAETTVSLSEQAEWHARLSEELLILVVAVGKICSLKPPA